MATSQGHLGAQAHTAAPPQPSGNDALNPIIVNDLNVPSDAEDDEIVEVAAPAATANPSAVTVDAPTRTVARRRPATLRDSDDDADDEGDGGPSHAHSKRLRRVPSLSSDDGDDDQQSPSVSNAPPTQQATTFTPAQQATTSTLAQQGIPSTSTQAQNAAPGPSSTGNANTSQSSADITSLAEHLGQALRVRPERRLPIPSNAVGYGAGLRSDAGPPPTFVSPPQTGPSARLCTLIWQGEDFDQIHRHNISKDVLVSHVANCALPVLDIGSRPATPEASDDEASQSSTQTPATAHASTSAPTVGSISYNGPTVGHKNVYAYIEQGRPVFSLEFKRGEDRYRFRFGFGMRLEHAPGPLPAISKPPCAVTMLWRSSVPDEVQQEWQAIAQAEFELWRGLFSVMAAVSNQDEYARVRKYSETIDSRWTYSVKKAMVAPPEMPQGSAQLLIKEREPSQLIWDRPERVRNDRKTFRSRSLILAGSDLKASFEEYRRLYNHLAADPRWYGALNDHGIFIAMRLIVLEYHWLVVHGKPADIGSVLASLDERIGPADVTIFDIYRFNFATRAFGFEVFDALQKESAATACPMPGVCDGCYRGSHIDYLTRRLPLLKTVTLPHGTATLGFPVHRLDLLPCSVFVRSTLAWDTALMLLNRQLEPERRANLLAEGLFDSGELGVVDAHDLLHAPLPTIGIKMGPLADPGNRWLAAILHDALAHPGAPAGLPPATPEELCLALDLLQNYDELVKERLPSLFHFDDVIAAMPALYSRVSKAILASTPSPDRIVSRDEFGAKTGHQLDNVQWVPAWYNLFKAANSCERAELGLAILLIYQFVDQSRLSKEEVQMLRQVLQELTGRYKEANDKTSSARLTPPGPSKTLLDFRYAPGGTVAAAAANVADSDSEDDGEGAGGGVGHGGDADQSADISMSSIDADAAELAPSADGGAEGGVWAALGRSAHSTSSLQKVIDRSPSVDCLHSLVKSLKPQYGDKLKHAPKMRNGLPTLDWFSPDLDGDGLLKAIGGCIAYCEEGCEELGPWRPPPPGTLKGDKFKCSDDAIHLKRSWFVGLTPCNVYGALLIMWCKGELDFCHLMGVSLRDPRIPITVLAHRLHGLPMASGFDVASPTHFSQYKDSSRMFIVECKDANWARRSWHGSVFFNNMYNSLPWIIAHLNDFCPPSLASALRVQLQELLDTPALMVKRANKMDAYALLNRVDLTSSRVIWKRLFGDGDMSEFVEKILKGRERAHRAGTQLTGVLPMSEEWTLEGQRLDRDKRNAAKAIAAAVDTPAAVNRGRVLAGKTYGNHAHGKARSVD